jgi:hypothetical protein
MVPVGCGLRAIEADHLALTAGRLSGRRATAVVPANRAAAQASLSRSTRPITSRGMHEISPRSRHVWVASGRTSMLE